MFFSSCADEEPDAAGASAITVLSYSDYDSAPSIRLCVFLEMNSDVRRAESIRLFSPDKKYIWTMFDPIKISNGDKMWAGGVSFAMPNGAPFPAGEYTVEYTDANGFTAECAIKVSAAHIKGNAADKNRTGGKEEQCIAVYDKKDTLLYYGKEKSEWKNDENTLWKDIIGASYFRRYIAEDGGNVIFLMPIEESPISIKED